MSSTTSLGLSPSRVLFGGFFALIASRLDQLALIAVRNGDQPYFGL